MHVVIVKTAVQSKCKCGAGGHNSNKLVETEPKIRKVAFLGDYLPRKCGIATFTSDLLTWVAAEHPQSQCFAVPVNDIEGGYEYPDVVRFEIEEQDLTSYQRAADFINISNVDVVCVQHEFGIYGGPAGPPSAGAGARTENARRHHVSYASARAQ